MDRHSKYLTAIKTAIGEDLIDRNISVTPENIVSEMKLVRALLDDEIKTLEGQIADSK